MNLVENKHYEIIPDKTDDKAWNVRVLSGPYTETVIKYGVVKSVSYTHLTLPTIRLV